MGKPSHSQAQTYHQTDVSKTSNDLRPSKVLTALYYIQSETATNGPWAWLLDYIENSEFGGVEFYTLHLEHTQQTLYIVQNCDGVSHLPAGYQKLLVPL